MGEGVELWVRGIIVNVFIDYFVRYLFSYYFYFVLRIIVLENK